MAEKIGLIADDFTGANDSGVQLALKGLRASVVLDFTGQNSLRDRDVLIIDTDSRSIPEEDAAKVVAEAASLLKQLDYKHLYKKIDSTLRGNVGAELAAVEQIYEPDLIVIAPALPKMGRITKAGYHYVNGVPVSDSEFGKDPKTPVKDSFIPGLLYANTGKHAGLLEAEVIRGEESLFFKQVDDFVSEGKTWIVCDAESDEDFQEIISRFLQTGKKIVWTGSAGLIEHLPEKLRLTDGAVDKKLEHTIEKTLTVSGSLAQITKLQLHEAAQMANVFALELNVRNLLEPLFQTEDALSQIAAHPDVDHYVLYVTSSEENREAARETGQELGLSRIEISERIAERLGKIANAIVEKYPFINGLVLTGGDTAKAVCSQLGVKEMELLSEAEPGLPFGKLVGSDKQLWAITKAGGFGTEQSLKRALEFLKGADQS